MKRTLRGLQLAAVVGLLGVIGGTALDGGSATPKVIKAEGRIR